LVALGVGGAAPFTAVPDEVADELRGRGVRRPVAEPLDGSVDQPRHHHELAHDASLARRLFREARPYRGRIALVAFLDLLATPLLLFAPIPLKVAVDSVLGDEPVPGFVAPVIPDFMERTDARLLIVAVVLQVLVVLIAEAQQVAAYVLRTATGERMSLGFQSRLFRHSQRLSMLYHDSRGTADAIYRIQWDAPAVQWITLYGLISVASALVMLVAMAIVTASIDWQLATVALAVAPCLFLLGRLYNARMRSRYRDVKGIQSNALEVVQEVLTAFRVVKAFGREEREEERFVRRSQEHVRAKVRLSLAEGAFGLLVNLTTAAGTAAVLYVGITGVQRGRLTLGELLVVVAYIAQLYAPLKLISKEVASLQSSLASAERAFELLDVEPDVEDAPDAQPLERARGDLQLRGVTFAYPGNEPVLRQVNLDVRAGSKIGVVGRTGAGKTTLVGLLPRFFDPSAGTITLDGVDIRRYRLADLRNQFAIVLQDPVLFSTTIGENIAYARPDASAADIESAAVAAGADEFIRSLPEGYDTMVGERGMRLSGGERQRIGLARAFLKNAPILILDEPTSSLDVDTEATIIEAMRRLMEGRTTVMIAHRLSTLDVCDVIAEVRGGCLVVPGQPQPRRVLRVHRARRPLVAHDRSP
jgi:ATP-binding cassette subfamily B protein